MSASGQRIFKTRIQRGRPISQDGVADGIEALARAIEGLEVRGENGIEARLDWNNGIPRITVRLQETTTK